MGDSWNHYEPMEIPRETDRDCMGQRYKAMGTPWETHGPVNPWKARGSHIEDQLEIRVRTTNEWKPHDPWTTNVNP